MMILAKLNPAIINHRFLEHNRKDQTNPLQQKHQYHRQHTYKTTERLPPLVKVAVNSSSPSNRQASSSVSAASCGELVDEFDPRYADQIKNPRDFFTGRLGNVEYLVCRDEVGGKVRAFHNVCRHHASLLASGSGQQQSSCFVCPYHGWTYGLDGALLRATRIAGIQNFDVNDFGLVPLNVATWGPFVLLNLDKDSFPQQETEVGKEWLGSCSEILSNNGVDSSLSFVCRRVYDIECNWKVFCDNYLDGGYHVPYAHKGLASGLKLNSYSTTIYEKVSIQSCQGSSSDSKDDIDRLGSKAFYAFIYPNFMVNRYGPWMDTNLVLPLGPRKCQVIFDYFIEPELKDDEAFINHSLVHSERVQMEDIELCEGVQRGLESPAYRIGRYAPMVENAMHHFHQLLHGHLQN
ncbi:hypothetical protein Tsubulata_032863 [Turnera subulata]|uniref:Choline monooxygenase, chloroplastic n=1 Tax=Turnera subulata TaxID=218843 RepID=A0A9Q0GB53_9ROSI|nr:hypothetical protein Tsubulata_032863 [Turnera subulata]